MKTYTESVKYIPSTSLTEGEKIEFRLTSRNNVEQEVCERHFDIFSEKYYLNPIKPLDIESNFLIEEIDLNVLRLFIKKAGNYDLFFPKEIFSLYHFVYGACFDYEKRFKNFNQQFIYLTVRTATQNYYKNSSTWHVDGFQGARLERHTPEVNYIWSNKYPTEFLLQPFDVRTFDYSKYNIHSYFRDFAKETPKDIFTCAENGLYLMDPYMIHRSPSCDFESKRIFIRINFSPVEIQDPTNTINPMIPIIYEPRMDVRDKLEDYKN